MSDETTPTAAPAREGSLGAPFRHPIAWRDDDYNDLAKVEAEARLRPSEAIVLIQERVEFKDDPAAVWGRLSDIERIPEFWHGTRSLEIIDRESLGRGKERAKAKAKFAFGGSGDVEITAAPPSRRPAVYAGAGAPGIDARLPAVGVAPSRLTTAA